MLFNFSLNSSVLLIFFFHGTVFSALLLIRGTMDRNNQVFGWENLPLLQQLLQLAIIWEEENGRNTAKVAP